MLGKVICFFVGHKKLKEFKGKDPPISIGWGGNEYYPMWACQRCRVLYISEKIIRPNIVFFGEIDQAVVEISNVLYDADKV